MQPTLFDPPQTATEAETLAPSVRLQRRVSWTTCGPVETVLCSGGPLDGQVVEINHYLIKHRQPFRHGYTGHPDDQPPLGYEYHYDGIDAETGIARYRQ